MPRSEAKAGTTAPPFHPNCRCVIVPYDEEFRDEYRIMRDPVTGKSKIIENMTFKEWKEKYGTSRDELASGKVGEKAAIEQKTIDRLGAFTYPGMTKAQNATMLTRQKELLAYAMAENNSDEVAFLLDSKLRRIATEKGDERNVDVTAMLRKNQGYENLQILHNHPRGSSFSMYDVRVLLECNNVKGVSLLTNRGRIETLQKTEKYDRIKAAGIVQDVIRQSRKEIGVAVSVIIKKILQNLERERVLIWKK